MSGMLGKESIRDRKMTDDKGAGELPQLLRVMCEVCGRKWMAFFPNGMDYMKGIECPDCGLMRGKEE